MTATAPYLCDTVTKLGPQHRGAVIVCGSHGGLYCGRAAAAGGVRAAIFSDAGVGLDGAGIASLAYGAEIGMAIAAVAHDSARIGDAADIMHRGVISHANAMAAGLGCKPGMACAEAALALLAAPQPRIAQAQPLVESRQILAETDAEPRVVLIDSAALVRPEDAERIVISGSHGGLVGNDPGMALRVDAFAAAFHDAGVGIDQAGITRLPALDRRGIAALTVAASSARIGDARSLYETGIVSHVNRRARELGVIPGQALRDAIARLQAAWRGASGG
jgi:hypothetical protein